MPTKRLLNLKRINIAIDGFSGTGKSSTAKQVAKELAYTYVDSGAMYRATTLYMISNQIDPNDEVKVVAALPKVGIDFRDDRVYLNGGDVTNGIRSMAVNAHVSKVSSYKPVREAMVQIQKHIGESKGVVMDGRDIGTVVFPNAELKVFMTSDVEVRARRRQTELLEKGFMEELSTIKSNLIERDRADSSRAESPLTRAKDAVEVDTSNLTFGDQVRKIVEMAKSIIHES